MTHVELPISRQEVFLCGTSRHIAGNVVSHINFLNTEEQQLDPVEDSMAVKTELPRCPAIPRRRYTAELTARCSEMALSSHSRHCLLMVLPIGDITSEMWHLHAMKYCPNSKMQEHRHRLQFG